MAAAAAADAKQIEKQRLYNLRCAIDADKVWNDLDVNEEKIEPEVDDSPGWKTVRIFVSSTFKDFHQEREALVKEVFYDLREWCEERQLHLIDCDLRWGVPVESTGELTLRTCLEEIDRCYKFNKVPYFINMICKRIGWIPLEEEVPKSLMEKYSLVFGLSVTEMEIVHAAYRIENPNALFLIRDDSFLEEIGDKSIKGQFIDDLQPKAEEKLKILRDKIETRYPPDRVITYSCKYNPDEKLYSSYGPKIARPKLDLDADLCKKVKKFFMERIGRQYPVVERKVDAFEDARFHHEAFMRSRCESGQRLGEKDEKEPEMVIGREGVLSEIDDYLKKNEAGRLLLVTGEPGAGKSSVMAKAACDALRKQKEKLLLGHEDCKVFFHFTGAVPNSTSLMWILKRLLKEIDPKIEFPEKLQDVAACVRGALGASPTPIVIFIDALNQISKQTQIDELFWIPERLSPNVRCVLSLISAPDDLLQKSKEIRVPALLISQRQKIVDNYLGQFIKKLSADQYAVLWDKNSSSNPLWLRIACEELRVYGAFEAIREFMGELKDGLPELIEQVLERFEAETDKVLLKATLCLLEVSEFGLLEKELLELLVDKDHLEYSDEAKTDEISEQSGVKEKGSPRLPYAEWVGIYRNLRMFLRPYGNPKEGRLEFYHRTLSEVVKDRYLDRKEPEADNYVKKCRWWRRKLAEYYRNSKTSDRMVEEYPRHLIYLKRHPADEAEASRCCQWMQKFLSDLEVFKRLYDDEFSEELLLYWRESGDGNYEQMCSKYLWLSKVIEDDHSYKTGDRCLIFERFSRVMGQAGRYEDSLRMAMKCLAILEKSLDKMTPEEHDNKLMYIYGQIANMKYYCNRDKKSIEKYEEIIDWRSKAIKIVKDNGWESDARFRTFLALQLNKIAFVRSVICRNYDPSFLKRLFSSRKISSKKEMLALGNKEVDEAIAIYKEFKDYGHELEALCTKGDLNFENRKEQLKIFEEARERCHLIFGDEHPLMCRLFYNTAIAYERAEDYENAYMNVRQAFKLGVKVYGSGHAQTNIYREMLEHKVYNRYSQEGKTHN